MTVPRFVRTVAIALFAVPLLGGMVLAEAAVAPTMSPDEIRVEVRYQEGRSLPLCRDTVAGRADGRPRGRDCEKRRIHGGRTGGRGGDNLQLLGRAPVGFRCHCDRDRVVSALVTLGPDDLRDMIDAGDSARVSCDFCAETYEVSPDELEEIRSLSTLEDE